MIDDMYFRSWFDEPNLSVVQALENAITMLKRKGLDPDHYTINPGHGSRRDERPIDREYTSEEVLEEVRKDTFTEDIGPGFNVSAIHGEHEQRILVSPPFSRFPFQNLGITSAPGLGVSEFHDLIRVIGKLGNLAFAGANNGEYLGWQRCDRLDTYLKKYGPNPGFTLIPHEYEPPRQPCILLDTSKNPGRISSVNKLPVFVAADMWLGPAFWKYAPCTKEEVLEEPWVEVEDTEHYLYLKAYPEPFTRPDGEQGRIQRRLWNVLFHQDCEWPPGSGTIAEA